MKCPLSSEYTGAIPVYGEIFRKGVGPVHMTSVGCYGNKNCLTQYFNVSGIRVDNCYHGNHVGIICLGKEQESLQYIFSKTIDSAIFYNLTISSSSNQSSVTIGSNVTLHYNVSPSPPINTTYQWRTTVSGVTLSQPISTYPNVTLIVPTGTTRELLLYCYI